jgi:hypothetical protein
MNRKYLVIVQAGDRSLHPRWLESGEPRQWDLAIGVAAGASGCAGAMGGDVLQVELAGLKWPALHRLLADRGVDWTRYDYVWLPDDDLVARCDDINRMFELMRGLDLHLAQPSFSADSHPRLMLAAHHPRFAVRYTSCVDTCAPAFSRAALERALPTLEGADPAAPLGLVWPTLLDLPSQQCAVIDRVQVTATRRAAESLPAGPAQVVYGGLDSDGRRSTLLGDGGEGFVYRLCEGYLDDPRFDAAAIGALFQDHAELRRSYQGACANAAPQRPATPVLRTPSRVARPSEARDGTAVLRI